MGFAIALASIALALSAIAFIGRARRAVAAAEARAAVALGASREEVERLSARVRALRREVETLSAIREVALIANDDVSFERIIADVLKVVEDLVESTALAIYLADEQGRDLKLCAVRTGGATRFAGPQGAGPDPEPPAASGERRLVEEAYRARRALRRVEQGELRVATLLYADAEIGGVFAARLPASGRSNEDTSEVEAVLEALAKHVALAVKKPTLYDKAVIDSLTRLYTKRHFTSQLARACALGRRSRAPFALLIADIDHFKSVNDTHGHLTGDLVLSEVAATIRATIRESDSAYRYGGEEMAVIAPEADLAAGRALAERIRAAIEAQRLRSARGAPLGVTASFGVAAFGPRMIEPQALVAAADQALYAAKAGGRNRVSVAGEQAPRTAPVPAARSAVPAGAPAPKSARRATRVRERRSR